MNTSEGIYIDDININLIEEESVNNDSDDDNNNT